DPFPFGGQSVGGGQPRHPRADHEGVATSVVGLSSTWFDRASFLPGAFFLGVLRADVLRAGHGTPPPCWSSTVRPYVPDVSPRVRHTRGTGRRTIDTGVPRRPSPGDVGARRWGKDQQLLSWLSSRTMSRITVFSAQGLSLISVPTAVRLASVMSEVLANSSRAAIRMSPGPAIVPSSSAMVTLWQFSMSTALPPVSAMSTRSMVAPPLSETQKMPRPPPRARTSPTWMLVG